MVHHLPVCALAELRLTDILKVFRHQQEDIEHAARDIS
jgi:hypothetical protein